ncbi:D-alanine--D-alanine ligase [Granulosicoccaceae sp. 1_MG-2023]|nr:D-alanine--D-alanine ligase [Granulosicoccaceae sp. 1_MG-2023]
MRDPRDYGKVAVLMGGWSSEREVSLMSGSQVLQSLQQAGVDAHPVDAGRDLAQVLSAGAYDRVFNILHGQGGEDGQVQGLLEVMGLPYTGSGVLASALAMDKLRAKDVISACAIATPPYVCVRSYDDCLAFAQEHGYPVVIKPVNEGSSIGVSIVRDSEALQTAWTEASKLGAVLAEKFIAGTEVTAAVLGDQALPLVSMSTDRAFYDYHAKYFDEGTRYLCPCGLPRAKEDEIRELALAVFSALGAAGWGRSDFMIDEAGTPYFIELNTIPGMTTHSLVPMAAKQEGIDFKTLCLRILDSAFEVN